MIKHPMIAPAGFKPMKIHGTSTQKSIRRMIEQAQTGGSRNRCTFKFKVHQKEAVED